MGAERINFWQQGQECRRSIGMSTECKEPIEYPLPLPSFSVGDLVKLTTHYETDSGRKRKRKGNWRVGDRLINDAERAEYARAVWASAEDLSTPAQKAEAIRTVYPFVGVDVHVDDRLEVLTPDCTDYNVFTPTWSSCEVRNTRTGEQFLVHRGELELA
jgi:hypothetical protein